MIFTLNYCIGYINFLSIEEPRVLLINQPPKSTVADATGKYLSAGQYQDKTGVCLRIGSLSI